MTQTPAQTQIIQTIADISAPYTAVLCDLWGCLHDGIRPFDAGLDALQTLCTQGKSVWLLTNSPRPSPDVIHQLDAIGVTRDLYHGVISSGDAAIAEVANGTYGSHIYHLGPARDLPFFKTLDVTLTTQDHADAIICTGLINDETETPDDYKTALLDAKNRNLPMLCANPDIIVDQGDKRIFCAGALAAAYDKIGGRVDYAGKPHAPIYRLALARLTETHQDITPANILCIGDGIHTDIAGATAQSMPSVFITGGLAARQTYTRANPLSNPNPAKLGEFLINQPRPTYAIGHLR